MTGFMGCLGKQLKPTCAPPCASVHLFFNRTSQHVSSGRGSTTLRGIHGHGDMIISRIRP